MGGAEGEEMKITLEFDTEEYVLLGAVFGYFGYGMEEQQQKVLKSIIMDWSHKVLRQMARDARGKSGRE